MAQKGRREGQIKPRGPDRWLVSVYLHRDADGRKVYRAQTARGGRREAEKRLRALLRDKDAGRLVVPSRAPFADFAERWMRDAVRTRTRASTLASYQNVLDNYVLPAIGRVPLNKLSAYLFQRLVADLTDRGLSPRTVRYALAVASMALRTAVRWRELASNPMSEVDLPKRQRHELKVPQEAARGALLAALERDEWWPLWCLMITTGLRPGEALGLQWGDVDLAAGLLTVQRSLAWIKGGYQLAEPKTEHGRRALPVPPQAIEVLRRHRAHQLEEKLKFGADYQDRGFVFAGPLGQPLVGGTIRQRHFRTACRRAALTCTVCGRPLELTSEGRPAHREDGGAGHTPTAALDLLTFRPYDLRHLHATLLLARGIDIKTISERLGHANAAFTLDIYTHVMPGRQEAAAAAIGEEVFGKGGLKR